IRAEGAALGRKIRRDQFFLLEIEDKFRSRLRHRVPARAAGARLDQDFVVHTDAAAAPVARLDERVEPHELIDDFLRLILGNRAPPGELAFFLRRLDDLRVRGKPAARERREGQQKNRRSGAAARQRLKESHSAIFSCARAMPWRYMALNARESFAAWIARASFSPVACSARNGKNMSLCFSSAWLCAWRLGISFQVKPMSSIHFFAMRVDWPPPRSPSRRSSLHHSVMVMPVSDSVQGISLVIHDQA